jgi:oxalate---CoA ligase
VIHLEILARHLSPDQPFYGVQSQGLDDKLPPHTRVEEMAAHYLQEIRAVQPEGPYYLGGFSFGGYVAYETACQLHAQGSEVALLALLDIVGPGRGAARWTRRKKARAHLRMFLRLGLAEKGEYLRSRVKAVRHELWEGVWRWAYRHCRAQQWPLPRALRDVQMFHRQALREYRLQPYAGRITLFRATERGIHDTAGPQMGWGRLAAGGVEVYDVPGDHATLVKEPHVAVLAERLRACLDRARQDPLSLQ